MASFATRSAGAWRAIHFDADSKVGNYWPSEDLEFAGGYGFGYGDDGIQKPTIDMTDGASSPGCLRFTINSLSTPNAGGSWVCKFADDDSIGVGVVSETPSLFDEIYMQCRVKWNSTLATFPFQADGGVAQKGIKIMDWHVGQPLHHGFANSAESAKAVLQTVGGLAGIDETNRIMHVYGNGFGGGFTQAWDYNGFRLQSERAAPYCEYPTWANCWQMTANEWVTFTMRVKILGRSVAFPPYVDIEGDMWVQNDGASRIKLVHWDSAAPDYKPIPWADASLNASICRGMLFPYMTQKLRTQVHPTAYAWYDELIIGPTDPGSADASYGGGDTGAAIPRSRITVRP